MAELPTVLECCRLWLAPPRQAFWGWSVDASAIEWRDGGTLLLRAELQQFVEHRMLGGRGLPPLTAIVFLFALLRDRSRAVALVPGVELPSTDGVWERVRQQPALRRHLVDCALFAGPCNEGEFAARVAEGFASELPAACFAPRDVEGFSPAKVAVWLQLGLRSLTAERLELLARTGVEELPAAAAFELPLPVSGTSLLQQLTADPELRDLAAAARQVQAALRLPRARLRRDEAVAGGFAGVTNRGPLDRLLPSELANDDDVLAVRIATNEALYTLRDVPMAQQRRRRRVLLDAGIRMWGTPRLLGVAVALAIRASAPAGTEVEILRADGGNLRPADLGSREGLVQQLAWLECALDARAAVPPFLAACDSGGVVDEAVVVTHPAAVADPAFRAMCVAPGVTCHVVTVDEHGAMRWLESTVRGLREVGSARLRFGALSRRTLAERPAYTRLTNPPLARPSSREHRVAAVVAVGVVASQVVLQTARGLCFELHHHRGRGVSLRHLPGLPADTLLPLAPIGDPDIVGVAAWGDDWIVQSWAGGVVHWLPRADGGPELTLALSFHRAVTAWCSETRQELAEDDLVARLHELVIAWQALS